MQQLKLTLLILFLVCNQAYAILEIEIKGGFQGAAPIAIVPFSWSQTGAAPIDIARIIRADLRRSGVFSPLSTAQLAQRPTMNSAVDLPRWQNTKAENLVIGQIQPLAQGHFSVQFKMLDVFTGKKLIEYHNNVERKHLRRLAHQISDQIYQKLTHTKGAFDTLIAYVQVKNNSDKNKRVYTLSVADSDGYNEQLILKSKKPIMSPSWSPDGQHLAYVSFEKNRSIIYSQELKSGKRRIVAQYKGINSAPAWSPDGKRLAMTLSKDGNPEIYILSLLNGQLQRITKHYGIDTEASWAPDGKSLVFTSDRAGQAQIYQIAVNRQGASGRAKRLSYKGDYNAGASFSPDGGSLVLINRDQGRYHAALLDISSQQLQLLTHSRLDESPTFAPNGKMILYATELNGQGILEAVAIDGSLAPQRLRVLGGDVREPAWSPYRNKK